MDSPNTSLAKVGSTISLVGLVACIVSTAIDYWYYISVSDQGASGQMFLGLWEICGSGDSVVPTGGTKCQTWSSFEDYIKKVGLTLDIGWIHACQAFMIMACLGLGVGVICGFLFALRYQSSRLLMVLGGITCILSGSCAIVASVVFGTKYKDTLEDGQTGGYLHAGFYLAILTVVLAKIGGIVILRNRFIFYSSFP